MNRTWIYIAIVIIVAGIIVVLRKKLIALKNTLMGEIWDYKTAEILETLHPQYRPVAKKFIIHMDKKFGIKLRAYSGKRDWDEQGKLYQEYLAGGPLAAPPGESYHNYALAMDVVEIKDGKALWTNPNWELIGSEAEKMGLEWGGRWPGKKKDSPHIQMTMGYSVKQLAQMYKDQDYPEFIMIA